MTYKKYQHVEKLGNTEVEGILLGMCYVFPKLDGTNAQVFLKEDNTIGFGSRNRELSLEKDNAGFMENWLGDKKLEEALVVLNEEFGVTRLAGEWLVPHSLKTYREEAWRKFYIFDCVTDDEKHIPYETYAPILEAFGLDYISPMRVIKNPSIENLNKCLEDNQYLIQDGKGSGEGIVIKNYQFINRFGRQKWAKIVTSEFKEKHIKTMGAPISKGTDLVEELIVDEFVTGALIDKVYSNILVQEQGWSSKFIPRLLQTVFYDLVREHSWDMVKKYKKPKIDYKVLNQFTVNKIKEYKNEIF